MSNSAKTVASAERLATIGSCRQAGRQAPHTAQAPRQTLCFGNRLAQPPVVACHCTMQATIVSALVVLWWQTCRAAAVMKLAQQSPGGGGRVAVLCSCGLINDMQQHRQLRQLNDWQLLDRAGIRQADAADNPHAPGQKATGCAGGMHCAMHGNAKQLLSHAAAAPWPQTVLHRQCLHHVLPRAQRISCPISSRLSPVQHLQSCPAAHHRWLPAAPAAASCVAGCTRLSTAVLALCRPAATPGKPAG